MLFKKKNKSLSICGDVDTDRTLVYNVELLKENNELRNQNIELEQCLDESEHNINEMKTYIKRLECICVTYGLLFGITLSYLAI